MNTPPILYSFRRCPYAMRARMALWMAGITVELREVKLSNKPAEMLEASPKGTVPVLLLDDGSVVDESFAVMEWALEHSDPEGWIAPDQQGLIERNDGVFKHHLDRYKYPSRYPDEVLELSEGDEEDFRVHHREMGQAILTDLNAQLAQNGQCYGTSRTITDIALVPFVRQFANTDRAWFDALELPQLQRWLAQHLSSDLFKAIMPKFVPWKAGDKPIHFGP